MILTNSQPPWDALAPLHFRHALRLTPEQFVLVCAENREAVLELGSGWACHCRDAHLR